MQRNVGIIRGAKTMAINRNTFSVAQFIGTSATYAIFSVVMDIL